MMSVDIDMTDNSNDDEEDKKDDESKESEAENAIDDVQNEIEQDALVTPQTLSMYYYGLAKMLRKSKFTRRTANDLYQKICKTLISNKCNILYNEKDENFDFASGLQVTGLITYSLKHIRSEKIDKHH